MSSVPTGGSAIKNILIGVVTTVVAYSIFYYFHDMQLRREEKHKKEKATMDAWSSLLKYENISALGVYSAYCDNDPQDQLENIIYEKNQLINNYSIIQGMENVDPDMKQFISSAISSTRETVHELENFLTDLKAMKKTKGEITLEDEDFKKMNEEYSSKLVKDNERRQRSITETFKILNDKLDKKLSVPADSVHVTEADLIGKWKEAALDKTFDIREDHTLTMTFKGADYTAKWSFTNMTLRMEFDDKSGALELHVTNKEDQFLFCTLDKEETVRQYCKQ